MVFFYKKKIILSCQEKSIKNLSETAAERPEGSQEGSKNVGRPQLTTSLL